MPRSNTPVVDSRSQGRDPEPRVAEPPKPSPLHRPLRVASSGSLAGAEDRQEDDDEHAYTYDHINLGDEPGRRFHPSRHRAEEDHAHSGSSAALARHRRRSSLGTPPSGFYLPPTSPSESRTPTQRTPQQLQEEQRRLSKTSLPGTPPRSTEALHLARNSPGTSLGSIPRERRASISNHNLISSGSNNTAPQRVQARRSSRSPTVLAGGSGTHRSSSIVRTSPAPAVSPPAVPFTHRPPTPPSGQRAASPSVQALSTTPPQLALQRTASRSRPFIDSSVATSPNRTPAASQGLNAESRVAVTTPATAAVSPARTTPTRQTPSSRNCSPAQNSRTPLQFPFQSGSSASPHDSNPASDPFPLSPATLDDYGTADTNANITAEEDQKDLLVERIIKNPAKKMGQSNAVCEKSNTGREPSASRSSPDGTSSQRHPSQDSGAPGKDGRRPSSRQARGRRTPSTSPADKSMQNNNNSGGKGADAGAIHGPEVDDAHWVFQRPPNNQRTFYFEEDKLEFSSQFDSGNLIQVERVGAFNYRMYTAMDCGNSPWQTNNRQWFHFSLRGGVKGTLLTITFVGMMHSNMFNFDWMPVTAAMPHRPEYVRLSGKAKVEAVETMPETPGYPLLVHKSVSKDDADSDGDNNANDDDDNDGDNGANGNTTTGGGVAFSISPAGKSGGAPSKKKKNNKKKKNLAMNLTFEYRIEADTPVTYTPPKGRIECPAIYIASNHPYPYARLQRNLLAWQEIARKSNTTRSLSVQAAETASQQRARAELTDSMELSAARTPGTPQPASIGAAKPKSPNSGGTMETPYTGIYYHREVLCKTLEGHDVTLLTISDRSRMMMERAPLISKEDGIPHSSAQRTTERPFAFAGKRFVVLTARVHPGECPGSHLMHGCIEFLMSRTDRRAAALRHHFVFYIIPMLNPDGVIRGHSRVDANGVDLNRMYREPSRKRHPAPYSVMALLKSLGDRVALFVDMHAHANKKGTFFYGNSMEGAAQVENLLYAKLVSLNTPYLDFRSCNFSEANMFAVGKSGKGKDSSSRVVVYTDAGIVHGYTIEASHVMADGLNPIVTLVNTQGEEIESTLPTPLQLAHTPATFGDTGRAMLVALLDLKNINPFSRLFYTNFHSTRGVSMWLQRQLQIETAEMLFAQAFKAHGKEVQASCYESGNGLLGPVLRSLTPEEFPDKITIKKARLLPRTTYSGVRQFLPLDIAVALLSQTAPTGPPRSLLYPSNGSSGGGGGNSGSNAAGSNNGGGGAGNGRRRGTSPASGSNGGGSNGVVGGNSCTELPVVIATKRRSRPIGIGSDLVVET